MPCYGRISARDQIAKTREQEKEWKELQSSMYSRYKQETSGEG